LQAAESVAIAEMESKRANDDYARTPTLGEQLDREEIDKIITSLRRLLKFNEDDNKEEFDREFPKIIHNSSRLNHRQKTWLNESSTNGFNFLMLACKYDNVKAVKFLLGCGLNVNQKDGQKFTASDHAWDNGNLKCLIELLNADAPFPKSFNIQLVGSSEDKPSIEDIVKKAARFHASIASGNLQEVDEFVKQNPKTRFAYYIFLWLP